jgi:hypothetical protein
MRVGLLSCEPIQEGGCMESEHVANPQFEKSLNDFLKLDIEELELIIAPGNTWSV